MKLRKILRWTARIWGSAIAAFVLLFLLADILSGEGTADGLSTELILTFICFPLSPVIGFILAWKWEFWGGMIALLGMIGLLILRPDLVESFVLIGLVLLPALIFVWLGWTRKVDDDQPDVPIT